MVKKYRNLTEKYRSFRLQPDTIYHSRLMQTMFNKFIKQGKKPMARRHVFKALSQFRFVLRRPRTHTALLRILRGLRLQFELVGRRQGTVILNVPVPVRRNKRDTANIQVLYAAVAKQGERDLSKRVVQELLDLSLRRTQSSTLRQRNAFMHKIYEERVYADKR